jgi:phage tail-like protein
MYFMQCSAIQAPVTDIAYRESSGSRHPVGRHYDPVTLRYGITESRQALRWLQASSMTGQVTRRDVTIAVVTNDGQTAQHTWTLGRAWPSSYQLPESDAPSSKQLVIAQLTLVFESLEQA